MRTGLMRTALAAVAADLTGSVPTGVVVLHDGTRLRFGADEPYQGAWIDGQLSVFEPSHVAPRSPLPALRACDLQGGRVELTW